MKRLSKIFILIFSLSLGLYFILSNNHEVHAKEVSELTIELLGDETIYLLPNSEYVELGAKAYDPVDGDISGNIVINSSAINNAVEGTYQVSYSITNSSNESITIYRNIIVDDNINSFEYFYSYVSKSINTWNEMIETSDGGFIAIGKSCKYNSSYYNVTNTFIRKYDYDMNVEWTSEFYYLSSSTDYCKNTGYDILEDNNKFLCLSYNSYYNYSTILVYDNVGNILSRNDFGGCYRYLKFVDDNFYIMLKENSSEAKLLEMSNDNTITSTALTLEYPFTGAYGDFVYNNNLYYVSDCQVINLDLLSKNSSIIINNNVDVLYKDDGGIYTLSLGNTLTQYDLNFNMIKELSVNIDFNCLASNEKYIIGQSTERDSIINFIDKNTLEIAAELKKEISTGRIVGYILDDNNCVYYYGGNTNNTLYIYKFDTLNKIFGLEDDTCKIGESIDFSNLIYIANSDIKYYVQNIDSSEFDNCNAGIYNIYFTIKYVDDVEIKTIQASKQVTVEHKTSLEDGANYNGFVEVDVEGAKVYINDVEYEYGDIYNLPGTAEMKILGENGYERNITFYIEPVIEGVEDNGVYFEEITPNISGGYVFIDGEKFIYESTISSKGNHSLEISSDDFIGYSITNTSSKPFKFVDGIYESTNKQGDANASITFTFAETGEFAFYYWCSSESSYDYLKIYQNGSQIVSISGITSKTLKTVNVNAGDYITFTFSHDSGGSSGLDAGFIQPTKATSNYYKVINFTIEPTITGVADGQTYFETIYPQINAENMTLNGVQYNNEPITNCGNYELIITGSGGYVKKLCFVIETLVDGIADESSYDAIATPTFTKGAATLNGEAYVSGTPVTTPGRNTLIITGEDGYRVEYNFNINLEISNLENSSIYVGSVTPVISGGKLTLNGKTYDSGTIIDVPGNYTLEINGADGFYKKLIFIVKPEKVNVINGQIYNHSLIPAISKGELTLNGEEYVSGTLLNKSGTYTLQIVGENGYLERINFTLKTGASVEDGAIYINSVDLHFIGDATLNGEPINPGTTINEVGNYYLELIDGSEIYTYSFVVEPNYSIFNDEIIKEFIFEYTNASVLLNGESYISGTIIDEIGTYSLTVEGVNGYTRTYNFDINPYTNINNDDEFIDSVEVIVNGGSIQLDGEQYVGNTTVSEIGNHSITIVGINGYTKTINFVINPFITDIENFGYYFDAITPIINSDDIKLDGEDYQNGTVIDELGAHTLVITGSNGYIKTVNFVILPSNFAVKPNEYYETSVCIENCNVDIEVDGLSYVLGTQINEYGQHTITFKYNSSYSQYSFYVLPYIEGVENGKIYEEKVIISTNYPYLLLDNNPYTSGQEINEIGNHTFVVHDLDGYNHVINFTIKEKYEGVEDGGVYYESVTPVIPNGTLMLNGVSYTSGTEVKTVGNYELTIFGSNGYTNTISFIISENSNEFVDGGEYIGSIKITIPNATLNLDGNAFSSGTTVYAVGYHTLVVTGPGNYEVTYNFTIHPDVKFYINGTVNEFEEGKCYENATYLSITVSNVQAIKLNDSNYSSGTGIYNIGNHNIKIYGLNDYIFEMNFVKEAYFTSAIDGGEYDSYVTLSCSYAQNILLNDSTISSGTRIKTIGYHNVKVYGVGGYETEINFTINPSFYTGSGYISTPGEEKSCTSGARFRLYDVYSASTLDASYYKGLEIDGQSYSNTTYYYLVGNHTLTVYGINDYKYEMDFVVTPNVSNLSEGKEATAFTPTIYLSSSNSYYDEVRYVLLDGEEYTLNTKIYDVGYHTITIYGANNYVLEYNFTILPTISGVKDGETYKTTIIPKIEYCELLLNDEEYITGTNITKVGNYSIQIIGTNGYSQEIAFKIVPVINGLVKDNVYTDFVIPTIENADLLLDGEEYISGTKIVEIGNHVLTIIGNGEYEYNIPFTIESSFIDNYRNNTYVEEIALLDIENCLIKVNGIDYILGDRISSLGVNVVSIFGSNDYVYEFTFTLVERPHVQTEEGNIYFVNKFIADTMVRIFIPEAKLYIDGIEYNSGDEYRVVGKHYLTIEGLNGYVSEYEFTINDYVYGLVDGGSYQSLYIMCDNVMKLTLNNNEINSGCSVNKAGYYTLVVEGTNGYINDYSFTITAQTYGVQNGGIYTEPVCAYINSDQIYLDGYPYNSGDYIVEVGYHTLIVFGEGGYDESISFTIKEKVIGIVDGGEYSLTATILVDGDASEILLNGEKVSTSFTATEIGYNYLVINGSYGYVSQYRFTINPDINIKDNTVFDEEVTLSVGGNYSSIILNGSYVNHSTVVNTIGLNMFTVNGINGYQKVISFTVLPTLTGVEQGNVYKNEVNVSLNLEPLNVYINGKLINNGSITNNLLTLTTVGNNQISIKGVNGYTYDVSFIIEPTVNNLVNNSIYVGSVRPTIIGDVTGYYLDGNSIEKNTTIDEAGYHTLTIVGVNGYYETYDFTITPNLINAPTGTIYEFEPIFEGNGKVYLNDTLISDDIYNIPTISNIGANKLTIKGNGGYSQSYTINIAPNILGVSDGDKKSSYDIQLINSATLFIDGVAFGKNIAGYSVVGNHTLTVKGVYGYAYSIEFTVVDTLQINDVYTDTFKLEYNDVQIYIDEAAYTSNSEYKIAGSHTLKLVGKNGYVSTYTFLVIPTVNGINSTNIYSTSATFSVAEGNVLVVDGVSYSNTCTISDVGNHTLKIYGSNDYVYSYEFVVLENTTLQNTTYMNKVNLTFNNTVANLKLDGKVVSNGYLCDVLGNHTLVVTGTNGYEKTYKFSIEPSIAGILEGEVYSGSASWTIGGQCNITVDGVTYNNSASCNSVGNHKMIITSEVGYKKVIEFVILPVVSGVKDGYTYTSSVNISVPNATLILNGKKVNETSIRVNSVGNNELLIEGSNGYVQTIKFVIQENDLGFKNNKEYKNVMITGIDNCEAYLNGEAITNYHPVDRAGKYVLTINGVNGYTKEYYFTILFTYSSKDNKILTNGGQIFVNGIEYSQGMKIETIGYNKITLVGANGYTEEKTLVIDAYANIADGKTYYDRVLIKKLNAKMYIDGVEIFEDTYIESHGKHKITLEGEGGYVKEYNLEVVNTNITYVIISSSIVGVCLFAFGILIIRRKRVI